MTTNLALKLLGSTLLVATVGVIVLAVRELPIPDILQLLAASSLSAIAGVAAPRVASSGARDDDPDGPAHRAP